MDEKRVRRRVRLRRPPTIGERLGKLFFNPRLQKRKRLERIAIVIVFVLVGMYIVISPIVARYFPSRPPAQKGPSAPAKAGKSAVAPTR